MSRTADATLAAGAGAALPPRTLAALHLAPGVPSALAYTILAAFLAPRGLPNMLALMLAILLVEVPVSWLLIVHTVKRETGGRFSLRAAFPWWAKVPWWQYVVLGVPVILFSTIAIGGVGAAIQGPIVHALFSWVPGWFVMTPDPGMFARLSRPVLLTLWALGLVSLTLAGGLTQELYFRGFLLPRLAPLGRSAPVLNAALFAAFHLVAPWGWPAFFLGALPWAALVYWRRSAKIGLFCHLGMLAIQWLGMTAMVFGLVSPPPGGGGL